MRPKQVITGTMIFNVVGVSQSMLLDSGASDNFVDKNTWETLKQKSIQCVIMKGSNKKLYPYASEKPLEIVGTLMSCCTGSALDVLQVGDVANVSYGFATQWEAEYLKVFGGVGKLTGARIKLNIDEPLAQPLRRTPYQLRDKAK